MHCEISGEDCPKLILIESTNKYAEIISLIKDDISFIVEHLGLDIENLEKNESDLSKIKSGDSDLSKIISQIKNVIINQKNLSEKTSNSLKIKLEKLEEENLKLKKDKLTGLFNRHTLEENYLEFVASGKDFSLAIIDLDDFKRINDSYGHPTGDAVLRAVSKLLQEVFPLDSLYRFGGEEFMILFLNTSLELGNYLNELLKSLNNKIFKVKDNNLKITFSGGVTQYSGEKTFAEIYEVIDRLLYGVKQSGKNRIAIR